MSFDFRNIPVYQSSKDFYKSVNRIIESEKPGRVITDQLNRASLSISLNIAEGYGRFHKADKRNFYVTSRASLNECVACFDVIFDSDIPASLLQQANEIGRMLSGLIKSFS